MTKFNMLNEPAGPDLKRMLLAVVLTSGVLMLHSYFFAPAPLSPKDIAEKKAAEEKAPELKLDPPAVEALPAAHHPLATATDLVPQTVDFVVDDAESQKNRASYQGSISNQGGVISRYSLISFSKNRDMFDTAKNGSYIFGIASKNSSVSLDEKSRYRIVSADKSHVALEHVTKEGLSVQRRYDFLKNANFNEKVTYRNLSHHALKVELVLKSVKVDEKGAEPGLLNPGAQSDSIAIKTTDKYERVSLADLVDKPKIIQSPTYAVFDQQFFLAALMPKVIADVDRVEAVVHDVGKDVRKSEIDLYLKPFVLIGGEEKVFETQLFLGPKQIDLLASLKPSLEENIDFGWFGALSRPMLWLLVQIYNFVHNYGVAIILITLIIKLLTYPLTHKSFSSQQEMKKIAPKIKELQAKHGHDRTLLGQKQMELYKEHGVNPVAGCLPMLIQLPIWFAFFQMLRNSVELYDQPFYGWITDLTLPDPYLVLPILMGVSMLIQQMFTPQPTDQPQMKYVMWAMPIFLTLIMLNMPSGLSLYILTNNLLTILQQMIIKRQSAKVSV